MKLFRNISFALLAIGLIVLGQTQIRRSQVDSKSGTVVHMAQVKPVYSTNGLPPGLTLSTDGTISGTPTVSGTFHFLVTVTDGAGATDSKVMSLTIDPAETKIAPIQVSE